MIPCPPERRTPQLGGHVSQRFPPRPTGGCGPGAFYSRQPGCHPNESTEERDAAERAHSAPRNPTGRARVAPEVHETAETPRPLSARLHRPMERPRACQESMAEFAFFRRIEQTMEETMARLSKHLAAEVLSMRDGEDRHHDEGVEARLGELRAAVDGLSVRLTMNEAAEALKVKANTEQQVAAIVQREVSEVRRSQEEGFSSLLSEIAVLRRELRDDGGSREAMSFAVKDMSTNIVKAVSSLLDRSCLDFSPVFDAVRHECRSVQAGVFEKLDGLAGMLEDSWRPPPDHAASAGFSEVAGSSIEANLNAIRESLSGLDVRNELAAIRWYTEDLYNGVLTFASKQDLRSLEETLRSLLSSLAPPPASAATRSSDPPDRLAKCNLDMPRLLEEVARLSSDAAKEAMLRQNDALKAQVEPLCRQLERLQQLQQDSGVSFKFQLQQLPELLRSSLLDDELKGRQAVITSFQRELAKVQEDLSGKVQESSKEQCRLHKTEAEDLRRATLEEVRSALEASLRKSNASLEAGLEKLDRKLEMPILQPKLLQVDASMEQLRGDMQKSFSEQLEFLGKSFDSVLSKIPTPPPTPAPPAAEAQAERLQQLETVLSKLLSSVVVGPLTEQFQQVQELAQVATSRQASKGSLQTTQQAQKELASQLDSTLQTLVAGLSEIKSSIADATAAAAAASATSATDAASPQADLLAGLLEKSDMTLQKVSSLDWSAAVAKLSETQSEVGESAASELRSVNGKLDQLLVQTVQALSPPPAEPPAVVDLSPLIAKLDGVMEQVKLPPAVSPDLVRVPQSLDEILTKVSAVADATAATAATVAATAATAAAAAVAPVPTAPTDLTPVLQKLDQLSALDLSPVLQKLDGLSALDPTPVLQKLAALDLTPVLQKLDELASAAPTAVPPSVTGSLERLEESLKKISASPEIPAEIPKILESLVRVEAALQQVGPADLTPVLAELGALSCKVTSLSADATAPSVPVPDTAGASAGAVTAALLEKLDSLPDKVTQLSELFSQTSSTQELQLQTITAKIETVVLQAPTESASAPSNPELTHILAVLQEVRKALPGKDEMTVVVQATGALQQQLRDVEGKLATALGDVSGSSLLKAIEDSRNTLVRQHELQGVESSQRIGELAANLSALSLMVQSDRPEWSRLISDSGAIKALTEVTKGDVVKLQEEVRGFGNFHQEVLWAVQEVRSDIAGSVMDLNATWSRGFRELHSTLLLGEERTNIRAERCDRTLSSTSKQVEEIQNIVAVMAKPPQPAPPLPEETSQEQEVAKAGKKAKWCPPW